MLASATSLQKPLPVDHNSVLSLVQQVNALAAGVYSPVKTATAAYEAATTGGCCEHSSGPPFECYAYSFPCNKVTCATVTYPSGVL